MTQENKKLLLEDLCSRTMYGVKCSVYEDVNVYTLSGVLPNKVYNELYFEELGWKECDGFADIQYCKPYLFPLSSITEEQQEEFDKIYADDMQVVANNLKNRLDGQPYETNFGHYRHIDWLNAHHFDYRGLIEKSLAIDATGLNIY